MGHELREQVLARWADATAENSALGLYALVDPAQDPRVLPMIASESVRNECMFGYQLDSPIAMSTPRLVALADPRASRLTDWLLKTMPQLPVATLLVTSCGFPVLASHLRHCLDVELRDLDSMFLALWDPAILGTLVGQPEDTTLHVAGPVLTPEQMSDVLAPMSHWWYCDRGGQLRDAVPSALRAELPAVANSRLVLEPTQVDDLVEASVPDHLLQHIRQNQPELLDRLPSAQHYQFVRQQLQRARAHGLQGMGDLVNYICLALSYGAQFDELPTAATVLTQVKGQIMTFDAALDKVSESELEAGAKAPVLL